MGGRRRWEQGAWEAVGGRWKAEEAVGERGRGGDGGAAKWEPREATKDQEARVSAGKLINISNTIITKLIKIINTIIIKLVDIVNTIINKIITTICSLFRLDKQ